MFTFGFQTPPKNHEKTPRERERKRTNEMVVGDKKKCEIWGGPTLRGSGPHHLGP